MYSDEKTIPFRLTPADLENLRMLRKRLNSSYSFQKDEAEDEVSGESSAWNSDLEPANQKVEKKISYSNGFHITLHNLIGINLGKETANLLKNRDAKSQA